MKYARIVALFAKESGIALEDALSFFYDSDTYMLISQGIADMHCRSDEYLADELMLEYKEKIHQEWRDERIDLTQSENPYLYRSEYRFFRMKNFHSQKKGVGLSTNIIYYYYLCCRYGSTI